ncbi:MAG: AraC family transcriptional regulator [Opitutaceae bacterium]|jgi:AraC family cel operon transcriptional repressor|nr:AraC family transcriptional regulator [Opitutaceae bacterium]
MIEHKRWDNLVEPDDWFHLARTRFFPGRLSKMHTHDFPELFLVEEGSGHHEINGQKKKLFCNDLVFVRSKDCHRLETRGGGDDEGGFLLVNLAFSPRLLRDLSRRHPEIALLFPTPDKLPVRRQLSAAQADWFREEVRHLADGGRRRLPVEFFLLGIALRLSSRPPDPVTMAKPGTCDDIAPAPLPAWLAHACTGIGRPENFVRGVPAFVKLAGRGPEHVARTCRTLLGQSPTELVNRIRIAHAARELRLGEKPVTDIALECGFGNLAHFYELFRVAHGETPLRYRRAHQHAML